MAKIVLNGIVGKDITYLGVVAQVEAIKKNSSETELNIDITSIGGGSEEARQINAYLKKQPLLVKTNAVDKVFSAGMTIFLAGQVRTAQNRNAKFLSHNANITIKPDKEITLTQDSLTEASDILKAETNEIAKIYSNALGFDLDDIKAMMNRDEIIDTEKAIALNFIHSVIDGEAQITNTGVDNKAVFFVNNHYNNLIKNSEKMEKEQIEKLNANLEENNGFLKNLGESLKNFFKPEDVKNLNVNAEDGTMIELVGDVLEVGADTVTPDAGTFTVNYEEKMWAVVIEANKVTELTEVEEEEAPMEDDVEALKAEIETLKTQLEDAKNSNTETSNKLTEIENKHNENQKLVDKLRGIESKMFKEDGSINFDNIKNIEKKEETPTDKAKRLSEEGRENYNKNRK